MRAKIDAPPETAEGLMIVPMNKESIQCESLDRQKVRTILPLEKAFGRVSFKTRSLLVLANHLSTRDKNTEANKDK